MQDTEFVPVLVPVALRKLPDLGGGLREERRHGLGVKVTGYERSLIDVLDAPEHGGGWEEIWRSLEGTELVDLDVVVEYALCFGSALTVSGAALEGDVRAPVEARVPFEPVERGERGLRGRGCNGDRARPMTADLRYRNLVVTIPMRSLDALGSPLRREILLALRESPLSVGGLAARFPVTRPAVSRPLRVLEEAGLVHRREEGTRNMYAVRVQGFLGVQTFLDSFWDVALGRLEELSRSEQPRRARKGAP